VASPTPRPLYPRERDPVPIVQGAGWAPGPVWTAAENIAPTGIPYLDRPARRESLYLLRYPGPLHFQLTGQNFICLCVLCDPPVSLAYYIPW
jgi:hypothetical protein